MVHTERPYYFTGEVVTGTVFVDCREPFSGSQLQLVIEGKMLALHREGGIVLEG